MRGSLVQIQPEAPILQCNVGTTIVPDMLIEDKGKYYITTLMEFNSPLSAPSVMVYANRLKVAVDAHKA